MTTRRTAVITDVHANLPALDAALAAIDALGCDGILVREPAELKPALERAFSSGRPTLVNVLTDPEVVYPRKSNLA